MRDQIGKTLLQRVKDLLDAREDLTRADFGRRIGRKASWISEFFSGKRTVNDLRLLVTIARTLGVSVGYLLSETERELDPGLATLLGAWPELSPRDRASLLTLLSSFRRYPQNDAATEEPDGVPSEERERRRPRGDESLRRKR